MEIVTEYLWHLPKILNLYPSSPLSLCKNDAAVISKGEPTASKHCHTIQLTITICGEHKDDQISGQTVCKESIHRRGSWILKHQYTIGRAEQMKMHPKEKQLLLLLARPLSFLRPFRFVQHIMFFGLAKGDDDCIEYMIVAF